MKRSLIILSLILIFSCKNESTKSYKQGRDTTKALVLHMGYKLQSIKFGPASRIVVDTMIMQKDKNDSLKASVKPYRYTYYLVNLETLTDSLIAKSYNIPEFDSTGKRYPVTLTGIEMPAQWVADSVLNFDSAVAKLKQFIPKIDTSKTIKP